jgi:ParB family chromosome partitioning protein
MKNILFEEIALDIEDAHKKGNLVYISTEELFPHPDNPRKDLGDLTELADSIRTNGVMQNLTVVPGHYVDGDKTNYAEDG